MPLQRVKQTFVIFDRISTALSSLDEIIYIFDTLYLSWEGESSGGLGICSLFQRVKQTFMTSDRISTALSSLDENILQL